MPTTQIDPNFRPQLASSPLENPVESPAVRLASPVLRVLLFAAEPALSRLAQEFRTKLQASVAPVADRRIVQVALQQATFDAILVEETIVTENPSVLDDLQRWGGEALVLEMNLALASPARVVRQLRGAMERQREEFSHARQAALRTLRSEFTQSVCGLLLESQLALRKAGPELTPALEHLVSLAEALSRQLQS